MDELGCKKMAKMCLKSLNYSFLDLFLFSDAVPINLHMSLHSSGRFPIFNPMQVQTLSCSIPFLSWVLFLVNSAEIKT